MHIDMVFQWAFCYEKILFSGLKRKLCLFENIAFNHIHKQNSIKTEKKSEKDDLLLMFCVHNLLINLGPS